MARAADRELTADPAMDEAAAQLQEAAHAKKCWTCGCLHGTLKAAERAFPTGERPPDLAAAMEAARGRLKDVRYDCLGCEVCYPALAADALGRTAHGQAMEIDGCPTEGVVERAGWPPLPGSYRVLRHSAPVAVCTLTDDELTARIVRSGAEGVGIVGTLQTENLGIERLILNLLANPHVRFLLLCGTDSRQAVGHLPGQSLLALGRAGVDDRHRILEARGRRPVLRNLSSAAIEHFRATVEIVDLIGEGSLARILAEVEDCSRRSPGPAAPFDRERTIQPLRGWIPKRMTSDPSGYFVVFVDRERGLLSLEHYRNDGVLDTVIEGGTAAELYVPVIDKSLITRLDHAAYLGRELARAESALRSGEPYVQDAAPEQPAGAEEACGCGSTCGESAR